MKHVKTVRRITLSSVVMALYVVVMFATASFAFGQYQVRIATSLYVLASVYPWLTVPLGLANMISNMLMGGLGPYDIVGGLLAGLLTAGCTALLRKLTDRAWILVAPVALIPSFVVPIWLSGIVNVPYLALALSLLVGQTISAYTLGIVLLKINWKKHLPEVGG